MDLKIIKVESTDLARMNSALDCFGDVFEEPNTYKHNRPSKEYLASLLASTNFICLVAEADGEVAGALAAYELTKFEQERSEIYVYDLAVYEHFRRKGIATALLNGLKPIALERKAWVIFVQADYADDPAVALYSTLGIKEEVLHFDIPIVKKENN